MISRLLHRRTQPNVADPQTQPGGEVESGVEQMVRRQRDKAAIGVSTEHFDFKAQSRVKGVKARQAWKYPGYKIQRAPGVVLSTPGVKYTDPKEHPDELPRRKHESNFFITVNPNKQFIGKKVQGAMKNRFEATMVELAKRDTLVSYLKFGPKDKHYAKDLAIDVIKDVRWYSVVETGENLGRMHTHISLMIEHYSQIQIDTKKLQDEFKKVFNRMGSDAIITDKVYVQVKLEDQSDWSSTIKRQYMHKNMTAVAV